MPVPATYKDAEFKLVHNGTEVPYTMNEDGMTISFYAVSFSPWELQLTKCADGKHQQDAQLAERKLLTQPARARNKSCAAKVVARRVCEAHFCSASAPGAHTKKLIVFST